MPAKYPYNLLKEHGVSNTKCAVISILKRAYETALGPNFGMTNS